MATGFTFDTDQLRDDVDYAVSHRAPPPIPTVAYATTPARTAPVLTDQPGRPVQHPHQVNLPRQFPPPQTPIPNLPQEAEGRRSQSRRRGSLGGILRGNSSNNKDETNVLQQTTSAAPPVPVTRIAQAQQDAAASRLRSKSVGTNNNGAASNHSYNNSLDSNSGSNSNKKSGNMLRKSSKLRQQQAQAEQERLAREAAAARRPPPHLPSLNPLPGIATFGGEDYNQNNPYNQANPPPQSAPRPTANFSRPGVAMAHQANNNYYNGNSSSPAYAARPAAGYQSHTDSSSPAAPSNAVEQRDQYAQQPPEPLANRTRYSYASSTAPINSVNSPRRVRRRKDPTAFNILVIGAKHSGKTSFISFLKHSLLSKQAHASKLQSSEPQPEQLANGQKSSFASTYLETEFDGERVGVTLWDSAGLEKNIVDLQLREMTTFVEGKFEETFVEEQKVVRTPGIRDTHIHCVFLLLDPARTDSTLISSKPTSSTTNHNDDIDLLAMRALWGKTTVIPIISKADTLTSGHMSYLKRAIWSTLKSSKLDPLEALELEDDDEDSSNPSDPEEDSDYSNEYDAGLGRRRSKRTGHNRHSSLTTGSSILNGATSSTSNPATSSEDELPYIPMSILSPDPYDLPPYTNPAPLKPGRRFPWGTADPLNAEHCDFGRLRDSVFAEWRADLRELSRAKWYENWRTSRLKHAGGSVSGVSAGMSGQRVKGGVTPLSLVPKAGRQFSPSPVVGTGMGQSNVGGGVAGGAAGAAGASGSGGVPRSVPSQGSLNAAAAHQAAIAAGGAGGLTMSPAQFREQQAWQAQQLQIQQQQQMQQQMQQGQQMPIRQMHVPGAYGHA